MDTQLDVSQLVSTLQSRIEALEARVADLEARDVPPTRRSRSDGAGSSSSGVSGGASLDAASWTVPYEPAELEVSETWIELHEPSARPQLQRLLREVVAAEGPITDRLALDRIRRAWGLKRAGGRVQEAFDQAVRQLIARALIERVGDALRVPGQELATVRVPGDDEQRRRAAEDVPIVEMAAALAQGAGAIGAPVAEDELTMLVAKLFGWTRRGGAIQERLDAALEHAAAHGSITRDGGRVTAAS